MGALKDCCVFRAHQWLRGFIARSGGHAGDGECVLLTVVLTCVGISRHWCIDIWLIGNFLLIWVPHNDKVFHAFVTPVSTYEYYRRYCVSLKQCLLQWPTNNEPRKHDNVDDRHNSKEGRHVQCCAVSLDWSCCNLTVRTDSNTKHQLLCRIGCTQHIGLLLGITCRKWTAI